MGKGEGMPIGGKKKKKSLVLGWDLEFPLNGLYSNHLVMVIKALFFGIENLNSSMCDNKKLDYKKWFPISVLSIYI